MTGAPRPSVETLETRSLFAAGGELTATDVPAAVTTSAAVLTVAQPQIRSVTPAPDATNVPTSAFVSAELIIPAGGIMTSTLTADNVYLFRVSTNVRVPATVNTSGGGDVIVLKPDAALAPNVKYRFVVTAGVRDVADNAFVPFYSEFKTGTSSGGVTATNIKFEQFPQATSAGRKYFGMAIGPDRRLYAGSDDGRIYRFNLRSDGSLGTAAVFDTIRLKNGGSRFITGFAFDPASTASNIVLWVTHTATSSLVLGGAAGPNWSGKVSVISGPHLGLYRDAVTGLPRSVRDHMTMQPTFGPDGALYFNQASQSSMGKPDVVWGSRAETPLSSAVLRLDVAALGTGTLNALTSAGGGTYNPNAADAKLTVYADGLRNAFDLVWHSNGNLYAAANGSAAGGNTPAGGGAPSLTGVTRPESDYLFKVARGGYHGHPNPSRGYYILNGGNPTTGKDPYEVIDYPVGQKPDPRWSPAVYDFGTHQAPAGSLEYKGSQFGGALNGRLLVTRYSGGDDIIALTLNASGGVSKVQTGIPGLTGLADPVDLVQDPANGNLYVIEFAKSRITLLRGPGGATPLGTGETDPIDGPIVGNPGDPEPTDETPLPPMTKAETRKALKIEKLCGQIGVGVPEVESLRGNDLTAALKAVKRLKSLSASRGVLIPDLKGKTLEELEAIVDLSDQAVDSLKVRGKKG